MLYLVALIAPPLAVLWAGHPWQALFNLGLGLLTVPVTSFGSVAIMGSALAVVHALVVVHGEYAERRMERWQQAQQRQPPVR